MKTQPIYAVFDRKDRLSDSERVFPDSFYLRVHTDALARKFSEMTFDGVIMPYSFPFLQMGLFVLVLFGLEVILSFWTMRRQKNQSLVEEMRAME